MILLLYISGVCILVVDINILLNYIHRGFGDGTVEDGQEIT